MELKQNTNNIKNTKEADTQTYLCIFVLNMIDDIWDSSGGITVLLAFHSHSPISDD